MLTSTVSITEEDNINMSMPISGLYCTLNALYENGVIKVQLSLGVNNRSYNDEMRPNVSKHMKADLKDEMSRLYFKVSESGENEGKIIIKHRDEYSDNPFYVLKLRGLPNGKKYCNAKIVRHNTNV